MRHASSALLLALVVASACDAAQAPPDRARQSASPAPAPAPGGSAPEPVAPIPAPPEPEPADTPDPVPAPAPAGTIDPAPGKLSLTHDATRMSELVAIAQGLTIAEDLERRHQIGMPVFEGDTSALGSFAKAYCGPRSEKPSPFRTLAAMLLSEDERARLVGAELLGRCFRYKEDVFDPPLLAVLRHGIEVSHPAVGVRIASTLLRGTYDQGNEEDINAAWDVIDGSDPDVRSSALSSAGLFGGPRALPRLQTVAEDPAEPEEVRAGAIRGVARAVQQLEADDPVRAELCEWGLTYAEDIAREMRMATAGLAKQCQGKYYATMLEAAEGALADGSLRGLYLEFHLAPMCTAPKFRDDPEPDARACKKYVAFFTKVLKDETGDASLRGGALAALNATRPGPATRKLAEKYASSNEHALAKEATEILSKQAR